jgi:hypothetical protein
MSNVRSAIGLSMGLGLACASPLPDVPGTEGKTESGDSQDSSFSGSATINVTVGSTEGVTVGSTEGVTVGSTEGVTLDGAGASSGAIPESSSTSTSSGSGSSGEATTEDQPNLGCADGEREGLEDELVYPDIAACAGGWTVPGVVVNVTNCDRQGGDDGLNPAGTACSVEDLCSEGWHVCLDRVEVMDDGVADCNDDTIVWGGNSFYATRQSGEAGNTCSATGANDMYGCGDVGYTMINNCAPLNRSTSNLCVALPAPWECGVSNTMEAEFIVKEGAEFGGVLCCRD